MSLRSIPGAELISAEEARALIETLLKPHIKGAGLKTTLDRELSLDDEYERRRVLTLPDGAVIDGDLVLDYALVPYDSSGWRGVLALGQLTVAGDIRAESADGAPFLVTRGDLMARQIINGGSQLIAAGRIVAEGVVYCFYNHGGFRALGGLKARGLVIDGQKHRLKGPVDAIVYVDGKDDPAGLIDPELLDDDGSRLMDDAPDEIIARMKDGRAVMTPAKQ